MSEDEQTEAAEIEEPAAEAPAAEAPDADAASAETVIAHRPGGDELGDGGFTAAALQEALATIDLRVWAELGRAKFPLGEAMNLPVGAVVDLDRGATDPVDLFVNGVRVARGELIVNDNGDWAVRLEEILANRNGRDSMIVAAVSEGLGDAGLGSSASV